MGGLKSFLFGDKPEVVQNQQPTRTPEQLALLKMLSEGFSGSGDIQSILGGTDAFSGKMAPDLSNLENMSLAGLEEMAMQRATGGEDSTLKAARGAVEKAAGGEMDMEGFNNFFRGAVEEPTIRSFREEVVPELTRRFSGSAAYGSDRRVAEQGAMGTLGKNLGASRAEMLFKTSESAKDRALTAAGLAPGIAGAGQDQLMKLLAAGGVPREVEDTKLTRDYSEFVRQQESKKKSMEMALALLGLSPVENIAISKPGTEGFLSSVAKGVGFGLGAKA